MGLEVIINQYAPPHLNGFIKLVEEMSDEQALRFNRGSKKEDAVNAYKSVYLKPDSKDVIFVACLGEGVIGYIVGYPKNNPINHNPLADDSMLHGFYIGMIFVTQKFRGNGVSKALIKTLIIYAVENGYGEIWSSVAEWNAPSISTHRSLGFKEYSQNGAYRFVKPIS